MPRVVYLANNKPKHGDFWSAAGSELDTAQLPVLLPVVHKMQCYQWWAH